MSSFEEAKPIIFLINGSAHLRLHDTVSYLSEIDATEDNLFLIKYPK